MQQVESKAIPESQIVQAPPLVSSSQQTLLSGGEMSSQRKNFETHKYIMQVNQHKKFTKSPVSKRKHSDAFP